MKAEKYLGNGIWIWNNIFTIIAVFVLLYMDKLVAVLGGSENTDMQEYLWIVAYGFPATIAGYVANANLSDQMETLKCQWLLC